MPLPRPSSPRALIADFRLFLASRGPHQWIAAGLAVAIPTLLFTLLYFTYHDRKMHEQIIRVQLYSADRTDAEIIADQKKAQAKKEARAKERQRQYQKLAEQLGIDD